MLAAGANAGAAVGEKAAAIVSSVSGEEILASIINSQEGDATGNTGQANANTSALKFAKGDSTVANLAQEAAKAAAVAGGIALRSLVKGGKLAANNNDDDKVVKAVGISAVNKLLGAVEEIVKKTVKNVLEKVKQEVDKARDLKAAVK
ncbi:Variable major outer membrane lipoprotein [Borrelia duttonii CR2A]|uniref:Variable large protein n=1 Tax=Borrelia duttonii CR2A TaxID=1432657 RepID=W6TW26_9SPIR|nr:Variable major outer membrane lipoprotein [Borrelia duttonii CR2A]